MSPTPPAKIQREIIMSAFAVGAILETAWLIYLGLRLPRHYVANHWDVAWVGLDVSQAMLLLLSAWAAWRRRAILIQFANACATLLLVDAWFDVTTARYNDQFQSVLALVIEFPSAIVLLWISRRISKRLLSTWLADTDMALLPARRLLIPRATPKSSKGDTMPSPPSPT